MSQQVHDSDCGINFGAGMLSDCTCHITHGLRKQIEDQKRDIEKLQDALKCVTESDMQVAEAKFVLMKAYLDKKFAYRLLYPSIIVRVIPKPDKYGMLILPEAYRNKPVYEGVVVQTWEEKTIETPKGIITMKPSLKLGDVVLFHHWAGGPVPDIDDSGDEFRILPDKHLFNKPGVLDDASPFMILDVERENPRKEIERIVGGGMPITKDPYPLAQVQDIVRKLFEDFDIVQKHKVSLTGYVEPTRKD